MTDTNNARPIGNTPIADAASATAPSSPAHDTTYPVDAPEVSSNADLRVAEDDEYSDASMSPTGADIDNDHADERPINRSEDAPGMSGDEDDDDDDDDDEEDDDDDDDDDDEDEEEMRNEQYTPVE